MSEISLDKYSLKWLELSYFIAIIKVDLNSFSLQFSLHNDEFLSIFFMLRI